MGPAAASWRPKHTAVKSCPPRPPWSSRHQSLPPGREVVLSTEAEGVGTTVQEPGSPSQRSVQVLGSPAGGPQADPPAVGKSQAKEAWSRLVQEKEKELLKLRAQAKERLIQQLRGRFQEQWAAQTAQAARPATPNQAPPAAPAPKLPVAVTEAIDSERTEKLKELRSRLLAEAEEKRKEVNGTKTGARDVRSSRTKVSRRRVSGSAETQLEAKEEKPKAPCVVLDPEESLAVAKASLSTRVARWPVARLRPAPAEATFLDTQSRSRSRSLGGASDDSDTQRRVRLEEARWRTEASQRSPVLLRPR